MTSSSTATVLKYVSILFLILLLFWHKYIVLLIATELLLMHEGVFFWSLMSLNLKKRPLDLREVFPLLRLKNSWKTYITLKKLLKPQRKQIRFDSSNHLTIGNHSFSNAAPWWITNDQRLNIPMNRHPNPQKRSAKMDTILIALSIRNVNQNENWMRYFEKL